MFSKVTGYHISQMHLQICISIYSETEETFISIGLTSSVIMAMWEIWTAAQPNWTMLTKPT